MYVVQECLGLGRPDIIPPLAKSRLVLMAFAGISIDRRLPEPRVSTTEVSASILTYHESVVRRYERVSMAYMIWLTRETSTASIM